MPYWASTPQFWLSLVLAVAGCTGIILAGRGKVVGWVIGLAIQPVWAVFAIVSGGYGLLLTCLMYGTVYWINIVKWRKEVTAVGLTKHGHGEILPEPDETQKTASKDDGLLEDLAKENEDADR